MITAFGVTALTFMMLMYALERRDERFVLAFAFGCIHVLRCRAVVRAR